MNDHIAHRCNAILFFWRLFIRAGQHRLNSAFTILALLIGAISGIAGTMPVLAQAADNHIAAIRLGDVTIDGVKGLRLVIETKNPAKAAMMLLENPYR
ncbi:MAG: N-acetylmuramoyl-L-alanine amidase, partial [Candidatus Puniceispirillum sp.]